MNVSSISAIEIDAEGRLLVRPSAASSFYEYIYREANGLRWDREVQAFCASEPSRWGHEELLQHIATTLRSAFEENLVISEATSWVGVPSELQVQLRHVLSPLSHLP